MNGSASREGCVVVLGASAGLGASLAILHLQRGDRVVGVARRDDRLRRLDDLARRNTSTLGAWESFQADLTNREDLERLVNRLCEVSQIDRLYLNAAADQPKLDGGVNDRLTTVEGYLRLLFSAYVVISDSLFDRCALTPDSTVVAISSLAAALPFEALALYCAGKAALEAWCRAARLHAGPRIAIVRPGTFESEFYEPRRLLDFAGLPDEKARKIIRAVDDGKLWIDIGGIRDVIGGRLASLLGPRARLIV